MRLEIELPSNEAANEIINRIEAYKAEPLWGDYEKMEPPWRYELGAACFAVHHANNLMSPCVVLSIDTEKIDMASLAHEIVSIVATRAKTQRADKLEEA